MTGVIYAETIFPWNLQSPKIKLLGLIKLCKCIGIIIKFDYTEYLVKFFNNDLISPLPAKTAKF